MLDITYAPGEAETAARLKTDLTTAGYRVNGDSAGESSRILIALLSPEGTANATVQQRIIAALDNGQHLIPVLVKDTNLPRLIDHLAAVDFRQGYDLATLRAEIDKLSAPDAGRPLRVPTPALKARNQRIGIVLAVLVLAWFVIGLILVGGYGVQLPREEYDAVDTQAAIEINEIVGRNLPRSTEDAANFPATLQAAPTAQRPLLIATTTAMAGE